MFTFATLLALQCASNAFADPQIADNEQRYTQQNIAVPGPIFARLQGQYSHTDVDGNIDTDRWDGTLTVATPFDFGLTESEFLDYFGWHFQAGAGRTENRATSYTVLVQPFVRDPEIGYLELNPRITHVNIDDDLRTRNRESTTYSLGIAGGLYLDDFTLGAGGTVRDSDTNTSHSISGFIRYYPPFAPFNHNASFTLGANHTHIDPDRRNARDLDNFTINYRVNWLFFSENETAISLFLGGNNAWLETNTGNTRKNFTITTGFVIWAGPEPGTLYQRQKMY